MIRKRKLWRKKNQKRNNKGMSLIEVIIAMAMLSIVALVVLRCMTVAMQYNSKARERQYINASAENLMEIFKGYKLEELKDLFKEAENGSEEAMRALAISSATGFDYPKASAEGGVITEEQAMQAPELTYKINGMTDLNGNLIGDLEIKATQTTESEIMSVENIVPTRDAIFCDEDFSEGEIKALALQNFKEDYADAFLERLNELDEEVGVEYTAEDMDWSNLEINLKQRDINITIDKEGTDEVVNVGVEYMYYVKHPYKELIEPDVSEEAEPEDEEEVEPEDEAEEEEPDEVTYSYNDLEFQFPEDDTYCSVNRPVQGEETHQIYINSMQNGEYPLERLYLFYYPEYDIVDRISINPTFSFGDRIINCFLIKQVPEGYHGGSHEAQTLANKDRNYRPYVDGNNNNANNIIVYHNLGKTLGTDDFDRVYSSMDRFKDSKNYIGTPFYLYKETLYKLEMTIKQGETILVHYEGTTNQCIDSEREEEIGNGP